MLVIELTLPPLMAVVAKRVAEPAGDAALAQAR